MSFFSHNSAGGSANVAGTGYQHRVAAWFATRILAEKNCSAPFGLPADTTLDAVLCESFQPTDDINVETSSGFIVGQAKRKILLEEAADSEIASALGQFVRQFLKWQTGIVHKGNEPRQPQAADDRIALITTSESSQPIRIHLASALNRLREISITGPIADCGANQPFNQPVRVAIQLSL